MASKFGGTPKCPYCSKSVYFAEQQLVEGVPYHQVCYSKLTAEQAKLRGTPVFSVAEQIHCNPEDKKPWNGGYDGGQAGPSGRLPGGNKMAPHENQGQSAANSCHSCHGGLAAGARFCSNCGSQQ
eukprot:TRINITY_DN15556_c0_g1_i1.p1 TRINITY_DN15556_c0_g1~~TRINITY_DN15556_c0_g1_i1.p1  ORF type:complete len:133 (+),score=23.45 TRINITY_DN15556_c0_g1_i1:25-399(+)